MAVNRADRYPGRWNPADADYPLGTPKNRTSDTAKDGSYFEKDWISDYEAFFGALLSDAGETPNDTVDTAQASQLFNAMLKRRPVENRFKGNQNWNIEGSTGDPLPSAAPTLYTVGAEVAAGRFVVGADLVNATYTGGLFDADSGSYYIEYDGDFTGDFYGIKLADGTITQTGCTLSLESGNTRLTVDMSIAPAHKFAGLSELVGLWPDISGDASSSAIYNERMNKRSYSDVTASRAIAVTYTNLTGCDIVVNVRFDSVATGQNIRFVIDGIETSRQRAEDWANTKYYTIESQVIPHGSTYSATEGGANFNWIELRV